MGLSIVAASFAAPASAEENPALATAASDAYVIAAADRIIVEGKRDYRGLSSASATKTDTPLIDVPQAVSVVSADLIADQALRSIGDVVRYAPGVMVGQGEGHRDQITLRGNNTTADFFVDGVRDDVQFYRALYNVERIEVLKGPNALIFGRGGGGGVVNRVLKRPGAENFAEASAAIDTFGGWRLGGDLNGSFGERAAGRLNAFYEQGRNHRDAFEIERYAVNPTFGLDLGADTTLGLSYEYAFDARTVDRGVPSVAGRPLEGFDRTFFGARDVNQSEFAGHSARIDLAHEFSDAVSANAAVVYGDFDKFYRNAFPATPVTTTAGGVRELGVEAYFDPTARRNFFAQANLIAELATGPVAHTLLFGGEFGDQRTRNERINGFFDSGVATTSNGRRTLAPLADPFSIPPITFRAGTGNRAVATEADVSSAYVQDQAEIGKYVQFIAGVRVDRFDLSFDNLLTGERFERTDDVVSPRAGVVFKPIENASLYASYSRSFLPQSGDQFLALDLTLASLEPERFDNYEVGAKWDIAGRLSLTAALYRLDRKNTRAPGAAAGTVVLTGEQRSRGLEIGLAGAISDRWSVLAGYTLQEADVIETTSAAPAGRDVAQVPRHLIAVWNRYDLNDRIGFGLGVQHQSHSFASISNAVTLPAFTRVDAAVFVKLTDRISAQANLYNILDADYFPTAHNDNNITTGAPASATFTLTARL